jgi:hypothetical protein
MMRIALPEIPPVLRSLTWSADPPQLSTLPYTPATTLRAATGCEPALAVSHEGWPVWWLYIDDRLWTIFELHVFIAIVQVAGVAEAQVSDALDVILAASIDLSSDEPVAIADLIYAREP